MHIGEIQEAAKVNIINNIDDIMKWSTVSELGIILSVAEYVKNYECFPDRRNNNFVVNDPGIDYASEQFWYFTKKAMTATGEDLVTALDNRLWWERQHDLLHLWYDNAKGMDFLEEMKLSKQR